MEDFAAGGFLNVPGGFGEGARSGGQIATIAPSRASSSATARPSPLLAAATMATRPLSPRSIPVPRSNQPSSRRMQESVNVGPGEEFYLREARRGTKMQAIPPLLRADPCLEGSREASHATL